MAGRHRHTRHAGRSPGGGAGHPPAQARGRARTLRRGLEGRGRGGRVGTGCRRAARGVVPAARRHRGRRVVAARHDRLRRARHGRAGRAGRRSGGVDRRPAAHRADRHRVDVHRRRPDPGHRRPAGPRGDGGDGGADRRPGPRLRPGARRRHRARGAGAVDEPRAGRGRGPVPRRGDRTGPVRPAPPVRRRSSRDWPVAGRRPAGRRRHDHRGDAAGGGAGRPGRDRQDVHPRRRPSRLRAGRPSGGRGGPVGPGGDRAGRRCRHPGPDAAFVARPVAQRLRRPAAGVAAGGGRGGDGRRAHPRGGRHRPGRRRGQGVAGR